ncbi:ferredoxin [Bacillus sp. FJAT-29814]|uniref:ferredoxin n=1 Tax=Bacillus sp. FJAT-29814 TaxID=1729688 RepID=UPI00083393A8|nr:ferredoxin [Bacillus sp. FJAT-29814]
MGNQIKVIVDKNVCIGSQTCILIDPGTFVLDSDGLSYVFNPNVTNINKIQEASDNCPVSAIIIEKVNLLIE